jgi:LacI family transcriptional regulator
LGPELAAIGGALAQAARQHSTEDVIPPGRKRTAVDLNRIKRAIETPSDLTFAVRLYRALHRQIIDGTLAPGAALPSEEALASSLGIDQASIRLAMGDLLQAGLLRQTRDEQVLVADLYTADPSSGLIGLVFSTSHFHLYYPRLVTAFSRAFQKAGYGLTLAMHDEQASVLNQVIDDLLDRPVAAVALMPPQFGDCSGAVSKLRQRGIPLVFLARSALVPDVDTVATNNWLVGYQATNHLIDLGHERIAHLSVPGFITGEDRAAGYLQAMRANHFTPHIVRVSGGEPQPADRSGSEEVFETDLHSVALRMVRNFLDSGECNRFTALFCFSDLIAMIMYEELMARSRRVPEEFSVIGVDNALEARWVEAPLTTFALPGQAIGRQAAELLLERLRGDTRPVQTLLISAQLIKRMSTAPPA